ncbi:Rho-GAP domain-containing protein [Ordospora pajunii]|uniref:Rho-GAP domain-containing protein n=1 Tax=Ordospora pajunii TaxID=3039483 RepID=UPI00295285ED|nr:Rho-GAP domain-containing protein [Ordospora pajunii]KAH9411711.1 Rho-GAP domain-containing protein [Ordospora pajunii]
MLKNFPRKRKIFRISEMKEFEDLKARFDVGCSEQSDSSMAVTYDADLHSAFQQISESEHLADKILKCKESFLNGVGDESCMNARVEPIGSRIQKDTTKSNRSQRCRNAYGDEFRYDALSASQKLELSRFCWKAFSKKRSNVLFNWVGCFQKKGRVGGGKTINYKVFDIIESLEERATHTRFIFRYEPDKSGAIKIANSLHENRSVDVNRVDVFVLANALKNYIREHLDGLVPIEVFERIKSCIRTNDRHTREALFSYVPFVFCDVERSLLVALFGLLKKVSDNFEKTEMSIDSLLGLFSLVLHPQAAFTTLDDLEYVQMITKELYSLDFGVLPQAVVVHELVFV